MNKIGMPEPKHLPVNTAEQPPEFRYKGWRCIPVAYDIRMRAANNCTMQVEYRLVDE